METVKIVVRIEVEVDGARDGAPSRLAWVHETSAGDNLAFYGHEVQMALTAAAVEAAKSVEVYVDYRPDGWQKS